jgi:hypothetical protein
MKRAINIICIAILISSVVGITLSVTEQIGNSSNNALPLVVTIFSGLFGFGAVLVLAGAGGMEEGDDDGGS